MAEKDLRAKKLESNPDVFASIFNGLLFKEQLIDSSKLRQIPTESLYEDAEGSPRAQLRDIAMSYAEEGKLSHFGLAILGVENQTGVDEFEPVRVMGYDYGSYRTQMDYYKSRKRTLKELLSKAPDDKTRAFIEQEMRSLKRFELVPSITIVLNFNKNRWDAPKNLGAMVDSSNKFSKWMKDYSIYVFDMCSLTDSEIAGLTGDFAEIAKVFTYGTNYGEMKELVHPLDVLDFLIAYKYAGSFELAREKVALTEKKGETITMGTLIDELVKNSVIDTAIEFQKKGVEDSIIINVICKRLDITEIEAREIFETEVVGAASV